MTPLLPGTVVYLDEIAAGPGDQWIGYITDPRPTAVRIWRGRLDTRSEFTPDQIIDTRTPPAAELERLALDIAATTPRERTPTGRLAVSVVATRIVEIARLARQAELDATRERQRPTVDRFNTELDQRRAEWAQNSG